MATKAEKEEGERGTTARRKSTGGASRGRSQSLRNVVSAGVATDTLVDLVERLGLVDIVIGRLKARIEETDVDELFDEVADYLKRNPEVLVVSLGALTVAAGALVYLNGRREWDGGERRGTTSERTTSTARVRRAS
jgi:hypothetical protein